MSVEKRHEMLVAIEMDRIEETDWKWLLRDVD
jgi:hypothetical protein